MNGLVAYRRRIISSLRSSGAYMRRWTRSSLVQRMTCRLFGAKVLSETTLVCCYLDSWGHSSVNFNRNSNIFIQENLSENVVWKKSVILCRPQCVTINNDSHVHRHIHYLIARFMGPTLGPPGADRTQVGPCWPHGLCYLGCSSRWW